MLAALRTFLVRLKYWSLKHRWKEDDDIRLIPVETPVFAYYKKIFKSGKRISEWFIVVYFWAKMSKIIVKVSNIGQ